MITNHFKNEGNALTEAFNKLFAEYITIMEKINVYQSVEKDHFN